MRPIIFKCCFILTVMIISLGLCNNKAFPDNNFIQLPYRVDYALLAPDKPVVYIINKTENKLYSVNYETGLSESLQLGYTPERMDIGKNKYSNELYITQLQGTHSYYWWKEDQYGKIAIIDRNNLSLKGYIDITIDPFDIIAGRDGYLYITSGSGQFTYFQSYNIDTKQYKDYADVDQLSYAAYHPSMERIYTIDTEVSLRNFTAYNISNGSPKIISLALNNLW